MKKLYVNNLEFSNYINPNHDSSIMDIKKIDIMEFIKGLQRNNLIKIVDDIYAENDPYLMPIYIILPLTSTRGDMMYFIDEYYTNGNDSISFLGGHININSDHYGYTSYIHTDNIYKLFNEFIIETIETKFSRSADTNYALTHFTTIYNQLEKYIDIGTNSNIEIQWYQYVLGSGLYLYTNPIKVIGAFGNLSYVSNDLWRDFKLRKDRDRCNLDDVKRELNSEAEYDCRINEFDTVTNVFELLKLSGIQN